MSKAKATSRFRLLQGQDATNASPGEWCSTDKNIMFLYLKLDECDAIDSNVTRSHPLRPCSGQISHRKINTTKKPPDSNVHPILLLGSMSHDTFVNHLDEYHEVHEMQTDEQHNYVVDSDADYTSNSNTIPYDQYMEDNEDHVVQRDDTFNDNNRKKAETLAPKPISALTVYPPNTPVKLVPTILPTKKHFVGVQTALFKEVKEMEEIFDQMNNEVDKNTVDKQCAEIEKKNLLIENENLIVNCLSTQLLYDVEKSRCLDLEADMSKEAPNFNSFFKIKNLEHQIQEKDNVIRNLKVLVANVNDRSCKPYNAKDVTALIEQNDCSEARVVKPLDSSLNYAADYKLRKMQVTFCDKPGTSSGNTEKQSEPRVQQGLYPVLPSTSVIDTLKQADQQLEQYIEN
ncbi:hypothetical protein Tco_0914135 [Tanacetum coccineum]